MSQYKYVDPTKQGYTIFKLTKKQHNNLFKYRQIKWSDRYEYYYNEYAVILHRFVNWKGILLTTVFFPIVVLLEGVINFKAVWKDFKGLYKQKELGTFTSEHVSSNTKKYDEIMRIIGVKR